MQRKLGLAALALALTASAAMAQQRDPNAPRNPAQPGSAGSTGAQQTGQGSTQQQLDSHVANCLILGNQEEIALLRWASEKVSDKHLKEHAEKMIEDHQEFVSKLRKFASKNQNFELRAGRSSEGTSGSKVRPVGGTREDNAENREGNNSGTTTAGGTTTSAGTATSTTVNAMADRLFAIDKQAKEECLRLTQECLDKHEGKEFDQALLGQQIGMHITMLAQLKAVEDDVSPEFQKLVKEGQKTAKEHKEHAEKMMKKSGDSSSRKSE